MDKKKRKSSSDKGEASNGKGVNINSLPEEMIVKIFENLDHNDLGVIARVCKQWCELTRRPQLWKRVNVVFHPSHESPRKVLALLRPMLLPCLTSFHLDFYLCSPWKECLEFEAFCIQMGAQCPALSVLVFNCAHFTVNVESVINLCGRHLPRLEALSLMHCRFADCSVEVDTHSNIKTFSFFADTNSDFSKFLFPKLPSLRKMRLHNPFLYSDFFEGDVSFLRQLRVLNLCYNRFSVSTIRRVRTHALQLTELYLCRTLLYEKELQCAVFPRLKTLCLSRCYVSLGCLISIIRNCPSLQHVSVNEDVAEAYAQHPFVFANPSKLEIVKSKGICGHRMGFFYEE